MNIKKTFKLKILTIFLFMASFLHSQTVMSIDKDSFYHYGIDDIFGGQWESILSSVNADSIAWFIQKLEDFETRYALHPNRFEVSGWIADQFTRFGYTNVEKDYFWGQGPSGGPSEWQENVIAVIEGTVFPDNYVIIGAHYDSVIDDLDLAMTTAPGADDNASGTAAVLEIARVLKLHDFQPRSSIRFITLAMEERSGAGSYHDSMKMISEEKNIIAMINSDMIGYEPRPKVDWIFGVIPYPNADFLVDIALNHSEALGMTTILDTETWKMMGTDSWLYHVAGFPAINFTENILNPHYHTIDDKLENLNPQYMEQMIKLMTATTMTVSDFTQNPRDFKIFDLGTGYSFLAEWEHVIKYVVPNSVWLSHNNTVSYKLTVVNTENNKTIEYETTMNSLTIENLIEDTLYNITLHAFNENYPSVGVVRDIELTSIPSTVSDFNHTPLLNQIYFTWYPNEDYALQGYKIYRRQSVFPPHLWGGQGGGNDFTLIATLPKDTTTWTDTTTQDTIWYEYKINAFFNNGNQSPDSQIIHTRHLSFNSGILIVDLTLNTEFNPLAPPLSLVTEFYRDIMQGFEYDEIKYNSPNQMKIEDFAIYKTFIIHKNSFNTGRNQALQDLLQIAIDHGANIIYTANNALFYLNNVQQYPSVFDLDSFPRQYFNIDSVNHNDTTRFTTGLSTGWQNISNLEIDPLKLPENQDFKLNRLEVYCSSNLRLPLGNNFQTIYTHFSDSDDPLQSAFDGLPVALYTTKGYSHIILTSIPLYFIKKHQAQEFMNIVLTYFRDNVSENDDTIPVSKGLNLRNYPNPFNPITTIEFTIPVESVVSIDIYNIRGQLIKSFPNEIYFSGKNTVIWDGLNNYGTNISSGIYLYQVKTDSGLSEVKKMVLLK